MQGTAGKARMNPRSNALWISAHGHVSVGRPVRTYMNSGDTGCSLEDLLGAMDERDRWRKRESEKSMLSVELDDIF